MDITHHALLVRASTLDAVLIHDIPETEVYEAYHDRFGIAEARTLVQQANLRPATKRRQCLVVRTTFITLEAQNALLKVLEEPPEASMIVFVVPRDLTILPTLLSRFAVGDDLFKCKNEETGNESNAVFAEFLALDYKERLHSIEQATKKKDLTWQREIKNGLIQYLQQLDSSAREKKQYPALLFTATKLLTRGASNKMLFEHLALTIKARSKAN